MNEWGFIITAVIIATRIYIGYSEQIRIPIGLFSNKNSSVWDYVEFGNGGFATPVCLKYDEGEQCKYYGECCGDVVRIRERLEPGTYQCMNVGTTQGYVVNRCPTGTVPELDQLCTKSETADFKSDLSLETWPVTGIYTGITYRNFYCAICNGALDPVTDGELLPTFNRQEALEFWSMDVRCTNNTIHLIEEKEKEMFINVKILKGLFDEGQCWSVKIPTGLGIHNSSPGCRVAITTCPNTYRNSEISALCENGPVLNVNQYGNDFRVFRNKFCKRCWVNTSLPEKLVVPDVDTLKNGTLLMSVKLLTQNRVEDSFSDDNYKELIIPSFDFLSLTNNKSAFYNISDRKMEVPSEFSIEDSIEEIPKYWDLGSLACRSNFSRVCGEFIIFPSADGEELCSGAGCGENQVQDLTNSCTSLDTYQYNKSLTLNRTFSWSYSTIGKYLSTCYEGNANNCNCDVRCHYLGDCCVNAPELSTLPISRPKWTCLQLHETTLFDTGQIVINTCPDGASRMEKELCEAGVVGAWNANSWLVTDRETLLTYKNIYCASCNKASNLSFWDVFLSCISDSNGQVTGDCEFYSYAPVQNLTTYFLPCSLKQTYIETCPDIYKNWKLNDDCETADASFVYYEDKVFRNYFCAICNLGDLLEEVKMETDNKPRLAFLQNNDPQLSPTNGQNFVRMSYDSWECCGSCLSNSPVCLKIGDVDGLWGGQSHPQTNSCLPSPFNTSCKTDLTAPSAKQSKFDLSQLCANDVLRCEQPTTTPFLLEFTSRSTSRGFEFKRVNFVSGITGNSDNLDAGSILIDRGRILFGPTIPSSTVVQVNKTIWRSINDTLKFCSNQTVVGLHSNNSFKRILLTPSGIEVKGIITEESRQYLTVTELSTHDYVLISLSLTAIVFYIIFLLLKRKQYLRLPEYMMIALLLSLFGALICYALLTVPAGRDLIGCQALAAITQFFFLASLTWNNSIAISIIRSLYIMRLIGQSRKKLIYYALYAFGLPFVCVMITYGLSVADIAALKTPVYNVRDFCFLNEEITRYALFLIPIYILVISNVVIGVMTVSKVVRSGSVGSSPDKDRLKKNIITCIKISICLGFGWVLLAFAIFYPEVLAAVHIFVELQGLLVVLANTLGWSCVKKVRSWAVSTSSTTSDTTNNRTAKTYTSTVQHTIDSSVELT